MKGMTKPQIETRDRIAERLETAATDLRSEFEAYQNAIGRYNSVVEDANAWREEVQGDAQAYYDERADRWQEGDRGGEFNSYIAEYDDSIEEVQDPDLPETIENLDQYPEEVGL